ncbi:MAG: phosphodiester glycosidase family protein [Xenococcaceae cyanobacterium MO_207.B15]|nr:phosphodiester glycosidase family protein [Xenococcaceae cyanobacterium MO_207.B15]
MRKWWLLIVLGWVIVALIHKFTFVAASQTEINYQVYQQPNSIVHVVTIPSDSNYVIAPEIAPAGTLTTLESFVTEHNAIAAINGGYFDPNNTKTTSYITQQGNLVADPRINERLIDNPNLKVYLGKILNRGEFRSYTCENSNYYDITFHYAPIPPNCKLQNSLGAGPQILPQDTSIAEGFVAYNDDGKVIRNAIGTTSPNARSAIAITEKGDIILAMVAQSPGKLGMSLADLAQFLSNLGAVKAMNLDGGSSSALHYQGTTFYGKLDREGQPIVRSLKSVLLVH